MSANLRLILAIITSLLDEAIIIAVILWVLPQFGIKLSLVWIVVIAVGFVIFAVVAFRMGTRALGRKPLIGLTSMIGMQGTVISPLNPEGFVKIKGELWRARAESGEIDSGAEVTVVGQEKLKLIVRKSVAGDNK